MDIQSIRRRRLEKLITEKFGTQAKFVEETGYNQGEVSALLKTKSFGERKARKIEADCNLPPMWLDNDAPALENNDPLIAHALKIMQEMNHHQLEMAVKVIAALAEPASDTAPQKKHNVS